VKEDGSSFEFLTPRTFPVNIYETEDKQRYVIEDCRPTIAFRRQGYGSQAMQALEEKVRE